jgi:high-affinity iron transporter
LEVKVVSVRAGRLTAALLLIALACFGSGVAHAASPQENVEQANAFVSQSMDAARAGDLTGARRAYGQYTSAWLGIEDGVRATSRDSYRAIERAMRAVSAAFAAEPIDGDRVLASLAALDHEQDLFIDGEPSSTPAPASLTTQPGPRTTQTSPTIGGLISLLADARAALAGADYVTAIEKLQAFETTWVAVEGEVKTHSASDYRLTETDMGLASALVSQRSPEALAVVDRMAGRLQPYQQSQTYGVFDAAIILLREGLEALLVIVALSAFLKKSGSVSGERWLWGGAVGGLLGSVALGLAIQAWLGAVINPSNREIMEGVIGLFAAGMLVYVSYWLHSKASLSGWQKYINQRTTQAVAGGQLLGLAVLAFLAVFREGAETSLFYLGMASNI